MTTLVITTGRFMMMIMTCVWFLSSPTRGELTLKVYNNSALAGSPVSTTIISSEKPKLSLQCGEFSGELSGMITFGMIGIYNFTCHFTNTTTGWVWINGHVMCSDGNTYKHYPLGTLDNPLQIRRSNQSLPFRVHITTNYDSTTKCNSKNHNNFGVRSNIVAGLEISWEKIGDHHPSKEDDLSLGDDDDDGDDPYVVVTFSPNLSEPEQRRDELQRSLATSGWGNWLHHNMLALVKLPEGLVITPQVCKTSTDECISLAVPDGYDGVATRVGLHAWDKSYVQTFVGPMNTKDATVNANVSMEYTAFGPHNQHIHLLITPMTCGDAEQEEEEEDCSDYEVRLQGRYAWFRAGSVATNKKKKSLLFDSVGFPNLEMFVSTTSSTAANSTFGVMGDDAIIIPLSAVGHSVSVSTQKNATIEAIQSTLSMTRDKEIQRLDDSFGPKASVATAIQAAVMWNLIYTPVENNGVLLPVSRAWTQQNYLTPDWTYTIFDWDNFFASLLSENKEIAYSNLFQVVKSKTCAGFIPNYAAGGYRSQDRTEPPVGAKTTLELYRKFQDKWMIEVVFDDLLDWSDWYVENRILHPVGLVALGSYNAQGQLAGNNKNPGGIAGGTMQGARYESGLDNSPMYDGDFYDASTHLMQLYDAGSSSLFVQEAYALSELAAIIGRPVEQQQLKHRGDEMAAKIQAHLWNEPNKLFANKFVNETFSSRISPTSFYALSAGAASDAQALQMVTHWMLNSSRFCISDDFINKNDDSCYWGLPSISADDPAFPKLGYWRGYIWGPMAMLTYWSLQVYDYIPEIRQARKSLVKQMEALMMSQWNAHHHICENYNPHKTAGGCSGTAFYHWGALAGLIGMIEDGYYYDLNQSTYFSDDESVDIRNA